MISPFGRMVGSIDGPSQSVKSTPYSDTICVKPNAAIRRAIKDGTHCQSSLAAALSLKEGSRDEDDDLCDEDDAL
jgi:hypothetical protein